MVKIVKDKALLGKVRTGEIISNGFGNGRTFWKISLCDRIKIDISC